MGITNSHSRSIPHIIPIPHVNFSILVLHQSIHILTGFPRENWNPEFPCPIQIRGVHENGNSHSHGNGSSFGLLMDMGMGIVLMGMGIAYFIGEK